MGGGCPPAAALTLPQAPAFLPEQQTTPTPGLGILLTLGTWSCILMYLCLDFYAIKDTPPTWRRRETHQSSASPSPLS